MADDGYARGKQPHVGGAAMTAALELEVAFASDGVQVFTHRRVGDAERRPEAANVYVSFPDLFP